MYSISRRSLLLLPLFCCILFFTSAYSLHTTNRPIRHNKPTHTPTRTSTPAPTFQTDCPTGEQARAATLMRHTTGQQQSLIYTYNTKSAGLLLRYDINTKQKTTIAKLDNATISNAQISTDGQFVLFTSQVANHQAIQLIRTDGQELQTLYCAPDNGVAINFIDNLLWSPDQQTIVFRIPDPTHAPVAPIIRSLHVTSGQLQTILVPKEHTGYIPRAWSGNSQVYLQGYSTDADSSPQDVYLLDIHSGTTKRVASIHGYGCDLCPTANGKDLLLSQSGYVPQNDEPLPPGIISMQESGHVHVIFASHTASVSQVRAASAKMLLFVQGGRFASGDQDGLWRINSDGSKPTLLTKEGKLLSDEHAPWSSVSRDGRLYAVIGYTYTPAQSILLTHILYGSLSGGPTTQAATAQTGESSEIVGWTEV